ncbi:MAG: hypothetical protein HQM08_29135 [Candidatus Riflebacteria bacterium]|nr:hypothetical protein [Candidatus Riflebacteria bacterium]
MEKIRLSVDVTQEMFNELEEVAQKKGVSKSDIMRSSFELMKLAVGKNPAHSREKLCLVDKKDKKKIQEIVIG